MTDPTKNKKSNAKDQGLRPDPETLNTTDPQEHMKGPVSSTVQNIKDNVEDNESESQEEATKRRDENL